MDHPAKDPALTRQPVVAGQFYPGRAGELARQVAACLATAGPRAAEPTRLAMVPHAGYVFSGQVAGRTLGAARLADRLVLLGPNHTGRGRRLAVWPGGQWLLPGGAVPVDDELAGRLLAADPRLVADTTAHAREHSLEVVLPFLRVTNPECRVVPICVSEPDPRVLAEVAAAMAGAIAGLGEPVSVVVSSDMSHYVSHDTAKRLDSQALTRIIALDPAGLFEVVRSRGITMCGVLPMVLGLSLVKALGAEDAELAAYATSGEVTGDAHQVVGYAGVLIR